MKERSKKLWNKIAVLSIYRSVYGRESQHIVQDERLIFKFEGKCSKSDCHNEDYMWRDWLLKIRKKPLI